MAGQVNTTRVAMADVTVDVKGHTTSSAPITPASAGSFQPLSTELPRANTHPPIPAVSSTQATGLQHQLVNRHPRLLGAKCDHVQFWKRLRAKKGRAYYLCQQCGVRWSIPSCIRASSFNASGSVSVRSSCSSVLPHISVADSAHGEAQAILGSSVISITESLLADSEGEGDLFGGGGFGGNDRMLQMEDRLGGSSRCFTASSGGTYSLATVPGLSFTSSITTAAAESKRSSIASNVFPGRTTSQR